MLTGGTGSQNLQIETVTKDDVEEMLSRMRSLLVFSVENRGPKMDTRSGVKKADVMIERWKSIFNKYDCGGTGTLGVEDVKRMVRGDLKIAKRLVSDHQVHQLFEAIDEDHGGSVEFNEFLDFVQQPSTRGAVSESAVIESVARGVRLALRRNKIKVKDLEENFSSFDESGDISTGELGCKDMVRFFRKVLKLEQHECSDKALRVAFKAMDDDGSGSMSMDEFMDFIKFCSQEYIKKELPARLPGLLGGMKGALPERAPSRRPGSSPGSPMSRLPFCLNGRDVPSGGRLSAASRTLARPVSEPSLATLGFNISPIMTRAQSSGGVFGDASSDGIPDDDMDSPKSVGRISHRSQPRDSPPKKRVWSGELPGKNRGGYMLLKGANALNAVENRLFEAGIDVRGNYHKLGRDQVR